MMKITCKECGKKYNIDETKIETESVRVKCKICSNIIHVSRPKKLSFKRTAPKKKAAMHAEGSKKVRFGLLTKIIFWMLLVSLVPFGIYWYIISTGTEERIEAQTKKLMSQTAEGLNGQVNEWLDKNFRVLKAATHLPEVISMNGKAQIPVMKAIQKEYPWMYLVFTVDPHGLNIARSDGKPLKDYSDRQYYKDIVAGKPASWQTLIGKTSKKPALVLSVPIRSNGKVVGVMAAAATIGEISKYVARWKRGKTGFAFLVDEKGKVVAHQIKDYVLKQKPLLTHPLVAAYHKRKRPHTSQFVDEKGKSVIGHVQGNQYGWALVLQQETDEVFEVLNDVIFYSWIGFIFTIIVVATISWLFGRAIVQPIKELTNVAERMSLGELNVQIDIKSKDEIGMLSRAVGRMQTSLNMAMTRLRRRW